MDGDPELARSITWERERAQELGQRYGWVVIHGPRGWYAIRGEGHGQETIPDLPALSAAVLDSHLANRMFDEIHARRAPTPMARSA